MGITRGKGQITYGDLGRGLRIDESRDSSGLYAEPAPSPHRQHDPPSTAARPSRLDQAQRPETIRLLLRNDQFALSHDCEHVGRPSRLSELDDDGSRAREQSLPSPRVRAGQTWTPTKRPERDEATLRPARSRSARLLDYASHLVGAQPP